MRSNPYHKIPTVYKRDPDNKHKTLLTGQFATPELEYLANNRWMFTEKVDGTNIRVTWDEGERVTFDGRTDRADTPPFLVEKLQNMFQKEKFRQHDLPPMTLYGEGYGAKIQKGGEFYIPDGVSFILFDVWVNGLWLERRNILDIAMKLNIKTVPVLGYGTLQDAVNMAKDRTFGSQLRDTLPEGLVMRPYTELLDRRGNRIICKIKLKDFQ